jgi:hypothetical protein
VFKSNESDVLREMNAFLEGIGKDREIGGQGIEKIKTFLGRGDHSGS